MAHIQSAFVGGTTGFGQTSMSITPAMSIGSGHGVCIYVALAQRIGSDTGTPSTSNIAFSDNATGNPNSAKYIIVDVGSAVNEGTFQLAIVQAYAVNLTGTPSTITITTSGGVTFEPNATALGLDEFSTELASGITLDQHTISSNSTSVTSTDGCHTSNVTTTGTGLAFSWLQLLSTSGTPSFTHGSNSPAYTLGVNDTVDQLYSEYILSNSAGTTSGRWTDNTAGDGLDIGLMTFKTAAAAPAFVPRPRRYQTSILPVQLWKR